MAAFKPIPDVLWQCLAALEARCSFCLWRERQWLIRGAGAAEVWSGVGGPPSPSRMAWRVRIFQRGSVSTHDIIDVAEPHLADGLAMAVAEAARRGWGEHRARAGSDAVEFGIEVNPRAVQRGGP